MFNQDRPQNSRHTVTMADQNNIESLIWNSYSIKLKKTETIAWGYNTTAIYSEDIYGKQYLIKLTKKASTTKSKLQKSIFLEHELKNLFPTPSYIKNNQDKFIMTNKTHYIRLQNHIEGTPPFRLDTTVFKEMIKILVQIHNYKPTSVKLNKATTLRKRQNTDDLVFLHGDLTPSNVLVSHNKIVGILDFEDAVWGYREYDVSRTIVFAHFRMKNVTFSKLVDIALRTYQTNFVHNSTHKPAITKKQKPKVPELLSTTTIKKYSIQHLKEREKNILASKDEHDSPKDWEADLLFTQNKLVEVLKYKGQNAAPTIGSKV